MLMERCEPGTALRALPEFEQDVVIAGLLRRLWRAGSPAPLSAFVDSDEALERRDTGRAELWLDAGCP